jgi:hypothetical protein
MSYIVDFNSTFSKNLPGRTFSTWLTDVSYADLNGLFSEIDEADWPVIKAEMLAVLDKGHVQLGQTSGLTSYSEDITTTGVHLVLTFDTKASYQAYADYCSLNSGYGITPGFAFTVDETSADDSFDINGREVTFKPNDLTVTFPKVGQWLSITYQKFYGIVKSCVHTET